eukprot:s2076_g1.t1
MSGYPDLNIIVSKDFDDFSTWVKTAPRGSLSQALEITEAKVHEWIKKKIELEKALLKIPDPKPQPEWEEGDRASIEWKDEGVRIFWPGTITKKKNFVRVRVMDETGLVEMKDCSTGEDYISPLRQFIKTERHEEYSSLFVHSVSFETQSATHVFTNTLSVINAQEKFPVGEILEWEFKRTVPGLPNWFSWQGDSEAGCKSKLEGAQFRPYDKASHIAPKPVEWPKNGVFLEQSGPQCDSRIGFKNCHHESTGIAIFVKVYAFEDRNEERPKALVKAFCHPGCQTEFGAGLPHGRYHIRVAAGHNWEGEKADKKAAWYDEKYLFGPAGSYMKDLSVTELKKNTDLTISYPAGDNGTLVQISQDKMREDGEDNLLALHSI